MIPIYAFLLLISLVCFGLEAFNVVISRINLVALGFFCWVLIAFLETLQKL